MSILVSANVKRVESLHIIVVQGGNIEPKTLSDINVVNSNSAAQWKWLLHSNLKINK